MNPYQKQVDFFILEAKRHFKTAVSLYKGKHYDWSLFVGHLTLEKLLKAAVIEATNKPAPYIHNLQELAKRARLELSVQQIADLGEITTFNLAVRYEAEQYAFYKKCAAAYAKKWLRKIEKFKLWLEKNLSNP